MSDALIAFIGAAIGGAIGIIGAVSAVVLDNSLRRRAEARKELERTKIEVYDRLYKLYAGICLLTGEWQKLPPISEEERKGYQKDFDRLVYEIRDFLLRNPIPESETIMRLMVVVGTRGYSTQLAEAIRKVKDEVAASIENQDFVKVTEGLLAEDFETKMAKYRELLSNE